MQLGLRRFGLFASGPRGAWISAILVVSLAHALSSKAHGVDFVYGIDVYNGNGAVNWSSVKTAGKSFAFVKATEGVDFVDARLSANMTGAQNAGVWVGPYHFARINSNETNPNDAIDEANDFVDAIQQYYVNPGRVLRPVLDVENGPDDGRAIKPYLSQWVRDFIGKVEERLHVTPIIYCNTNYATNYFETDLNVYPLWLASINTAPPNLPPASADGIWSGWNFWQYSWTGGVSGVPSADVDKDAYVGTLDQLVAEFRGVQPDGDFNNDGLTDGRDLLAWQRGLGMASAAHAQGDADGDRDVDAADLAVWQANTPAPPLEGLAGLGVVPEPGALALAFVAAAAFARCRAA